MWGRGSIPQSPGDGDIPSFGGSVFPGRDFHKRFFVYTFSNPVLRQEGVRGSVGGVAFPELGHKALAQTSPRRVGRIPCSRSPLQPRADDSGPFRFRGRGSLQTPLIEEGLIFSSSSCCFRRGRERWPPSSLHLGAESQPFPCSDGPAPPSPTGVTPSS